jgi:3-oxoacyl-[acyl-carrier protein] reductase
MTRRRALVTGATSSIGAAIAHALAPDHALVLVGRRAETLDAVGAPLGAACRVGDLTDPAFRASLVDDEGYDAFVHVAGHAFTYARHHTFSKDDEASVWGVDFDAASDLAARVVVGMMQRRRGRIVLIGSLAATYAGGGSAHYAAAKAALEGLSRGLATDYGRFHITSNVVAPGVIETERIARRIDEAKRQKIVQATSLKRIGTPNDVAAPVKFLCSDDASYITGTTLVVSGGLHLNAWW